MPEEKSPTLMTEGMLGDLTHEVEATKARDSGEWRGQTLLKSKTTIRAIKLMMKSNISVVDQQIEAQYAN